MVKKAKNEKPPGKFEAIVGRIFIWLVLVISPIIVIDLISPFFLSHRSEIEKKFPVQVIRKPKPYVMFGGEKQGEIENGEKLNDLGYRGKSPSYNKGEGEYRIFILGGSTVFAGNPPIPELLEQEFRKNDFTNIKVFNFGVVSSVSSMELTRIVFEISDYKPDLILMYNGCNEILQPYEYDPRPGYPFNYLVYEANPLLESDVKTYPAVNLLLYGSNLARYFMGEHFLKVFVRLDDTRNQVKYRTREWQDQIADIYVNNLIKANKVSAAFDSDFIAFFQPILCFKNHINEEEQVSEKDRKRFEEFREHSLYIRDKIHKLIEERQAENIFVDLSDIYDKTTGKVFIDGFHTYQESKPVITEEIYKYLANNVMVNKNNSI